jgi:hypothetical protein
LYGRRSAPARQQRGVNVEAAPLRDLEHRGGKYEAIGDHDQQVDLCGPQHLECFGCLEARGLVHVEPKFERPPLDGTWVLALPTASRPVRLSKNRSDRMALGQPFERRNREVRRAGEAQLQRRSAAQGSKSRRVRA